MVAWMGGREGCQWSPGSMPDTAGRTRRSSPRSPARTSTRRPRSARSGVRSSTAVGSTASARVLVIGQDPATHETICRRILVGEAGQRAQGLLAKLGITRSYVLINAFLYSVFGQGGGTRHIDDPAITAYRNRWLDTHRPAQRPAGRHHVRPARRSRLRGVEGDAGRCGVPGRARQRHPPDVPRVGERVGAARPRRRRWQRLCTSWNAALAALRPVVTPDEARPPSSTARRSPRPTWRRSPTRTSRPGCPAWMRSLDAWASRSGADAQAKRATITVAVPRAARTWPALD